MKIQQKRAIWDADECLISMIPMFIIYLNKRLNLKLKYQDFTSFSYEAVTGIPEKEMKLLEREFYETTLYDEIEPKHGAVEVIEYLSKELNMDVATGRSKCDEIHLNRTISKLFKPHHFEKIFHLGKNDDVGLIIPKWLKCKERGASLIIDDSASTIINAGQNGIHGILVEAPWNKKVTDLPKIVTRARNNYEVAEIMIRKREIFWPHG
jgi:uncharacterized HAD superfamily protein